MSRIAYVNGRYVPHREASVHVEDRGYQFADAVYEVVHVHAGRFVDDGPHLDRLERSLREIRIPMPMPRAALMAVLREVVRRNRIDEGLLYMQVSRGVARRDHAFPSKPVPPAIVITVKRIKPYPTSIDTWGTTAITYPDQRWHAATSRPSASCRTCSPARRRRRRAQPRRSWSRPTAW